MEAYERFTRAFSFQEPDRVPIYDLLNNPQLYRRFGGEGTALEVAARTYRSLGVDATRFYIDPAQNWMDGMIEEWVHFLGVEPTGWEIRESSGIPWIAQRPFSNLKELKEHLPQYPDRNKVSQWYAQESTKVRDAFAPHTVFIGATGGCISGPYTYCGAELFFEAYCYAPDILHHLMDVFTEWAFSLAKTYADHDLGPVCFLGDDIAYKTALLFSPQFLRQEFIPRIKRMMEPLKEKGIKVMFHSDGNLNEILDELVYTLEIDGLNPLEPLADMEVIRLSKEYPHLVMCGGIDVSQLLPFGTAQEIRAKVKEVIKEVAPGGGLCIGSSTEIHPGVPVENVLAFYNAVREFGQYPIRL